MGAAATQKAEQARIAQVAAGASDAIECARMAANRTPFARVLSVCMGQDGSGNVTPTGNLPQGSFAQASLPPMA